MDVLIRRLLLAASVLVCAFALASDGEPDLDEHAILVAAQSKFLCNSTDEYILTLKFLRTTKEVLFPQITARLIAEKVARGCNGAAERFSEIILLLKTVGVSDRRALEMSMEFANESPDVQKNFKEIFSKAFLNEFFDFDYRLALKLALELSRDYKGDPAQVRNDFLELVKYCKDGKTLDLPTRVCAEYTVKLAKLSQYFPSGVRAPFYELFKQLRDKDGMGLDIKTSLQISYNVLKNGPRAPENFYSAYQFALNKEGLNVDRRQALAFGVRMAERSFIGGPTPPPIPAPSKAPDLTSAANP